MCVCVCVCVCVRACVRVIVCVCVCVPGFIGYAGEVAAVIADHKIQDSDDDQLYYTQIYLDQQKRVSVCAECEVC